MVHKREARLLRCYLHEKRSQAVHLRSRGSWLRIPEEIAWIQKMATIPSAALSLGGIQRSPIDISIWHVLSGDSLMQRKTYMSS